MKNEYFQNDIIDLRILGDIGSVCIYRFPSILRLVAMFTTIKFNHTTHLTHNKLFFKFCLIA